MSEIVKPSRIGLTYGLVLGFIMIFVFILQQFVPFITPSRLSIINLLVLAIGLVMATLAVRKQNSGLMTFGQGMRPNSMLILVSTIVSSLFTYVYVKFIDDFYLQSLKDARLESLKEKVSEEQAEIMIQNAGSFFSAEFIMIPLLVSKFVLGFVFTFFIVAVLTKKESENVNR